MFFRTWRTVSSFRLRGFIFRSAGIFRGYYISEGLNYACKGSINVGRHVVIHSRASINSREGSILTIGDRTRIGTDAVIACGSSVIIGESVLIAARCYIADYSHAFDRPDVPVMQQGASVPKPVMIGSGSWLGINVSILPGVTLGRNCVVAAGSVVTKSFPDYSVVGGVPAKLLKKIPDGISVSDPMIDG